MKRLIIYLERVDKTSDNKLYNVVNIPFSTEKEKFHHLSMYDGKVKSYKESFYKV